MTKNNYNYYQGSTMSEIYKRKKRNQDEDSKEEEKNIDNSLYKNYFNEIFDNYCNAHLDKPYMYQVWLVANDVSDIENITKVITKYFCDNVRQASKIAEEIINDGKALCGIFPKDSAETKIDEINNYTNNNGNIVHCVIQKGCTYVVKKS